MTRDYTVLIQVHSAAADCLHIQKCVQTNL